MEGNKKDKNSKQRLSHYSNVDEPEYDVVEDQEEVLNVHIQPAWPLQPDREYADRAVPRSSSAQSTRSTSSCNSSTPPRCPPRETLCNPGPVINRRLKPRRRLTLDENKPAVKPREQNHPLSQRSPPSLVNEMANRLSAMQLQRTRRTEVQKSTTPAKLSEPTEGLQSPESDSSHTSLRYSLDLNGQCDIDKRSHQKFKSQDRSSSRRQNHEWPLTKEDFDQHDFVPKEKPQQSYYEDDWYVGTYTREEAEHALHLVNKDGAFLVRDCSKNTTSEPFVLAVYHEKKVYNVKIRFIESTSKYALGKGQRANDMFHSVADIVKFHSIFPISLISGRNQAANKLGNCVLTFPITKKDVDQLLG
ncbi:uncharacterized protein clnk [Polymixia lowei]